MRVENGRGRDKRGLQNITGPPPRYLNTQICPGTRNIARGNVNAEDRSHTIVWLTVSAPTL